MKLIIPYIVLFCATAQAQTLIRTFEPSVVRGDGFETGDFTAWDWSTYGDTVWSVTSDVPASGTYAAIAGTTTGSASSVLSLPLNTAGSLRFIHNWPSSGTMSLVIDSVTDTEWGPSSSSAGSAQWFTSETALGSGAHTVEWVFSGGAVQPFYENAAYLDDIRLVTGGHADDVRCVAWSPDANYIATGSLDGTAKIWSATDGTLVLSITADTSDGVLGIAWNSSSNKIATGGWDETGKVFSATDGVQSVTLTGHTGRITSVHWSADGSRIATGSSDDTAIVWTASTGAIVNTLSGHAGACNDVRWFPTGSTNLLTGDDSGVLRYWNATAGTVYKTYSCGIAIGGVCWDKTGISVLAGCDDGKIRQFNASTAIPELTYDSQGLGEISDIDVTKNGTWLLASHSTAYVSKYLVNQNEGRRAGYYTGHDGGVHGVASDPRTTKQVAVSAGADKTARVWTINTLSPLLTLQGAEYTVDDFETGDWTAATWGSDWSIQSATVNQATYAAQSGAVGYNAVSSATLTLNSVDGHLIFDRRIHAEENQGTFSVDVDGTEEYTTTGEQDWAEVSFGVASGTKTIAFNYTTGAGASVWENSAFIDDVSFTATGHSGRITALGFNADSTKLISAESRDFVGAKTLYLKKWDIDNNALLSDLHTFNEQILTARYSQDYSRICAASADGTGIVLDATSSATIYHATFGPSLTIPSATGLIHRDGWLPPNQAVAAAFSGDGTTVVTAHGYPNYYYYVRAASDGVASGTYGATAEARGVASNSDGSGNAFHFDPDESYRRIVVQASPTLVIPGNITTVDPVGPLVYSPDDNYLLVAWNDTTARVLSATDGTEILSVSQPLFIHTHINNTTESIRPHVQALGYSGDGNRIILAGRSHASVLSATDGTVIYSVTAALTPTITVPQDAWAAALNETGSRWAVGFVGGTIKVWSE